MPSRRTFAAAMLAAADSKENSLRTGAGSTADPRKSLMSREYRHEGVRVEKSQKPRPNDAIMKSRKSTLFRSPTLLRFVNFLLLFAVVAVFPVVTHASIIYVDATHGASGNTGQTGEPVTETGWVTTGASTTNDSQWGTRTFGTNSTVYQGYLADAATQANYTDFPKLTTTISGLTAGQTYNVYAFFWDSSTANSSWSLGVGLTSPPTVTYYNPDDTAPLIGTKGTGTLSGTAVLASTLTYAPNAAPLFTESDRSLFAVALGPTTASGGSIGVYIAQLIQTRGNTTSPSNPATRTWYDGVGYEIVAVPEPSAAILVGLGLVGLCLWGRGKPRRRMN